jgi:hypothetical protein
MSNHRANAENQMINLRKYLFLMNYLLTTDGWPRAEMLRYCSASNWSFAPHLRKSEPAARARRCSAQQFCVGNHLFRDRAQ